MKRLTYCGILLCTIIMFSTSAGCQKGNEGKDDKTEVTPNPGSSTEEPGVPRVVRGFMMPEKNTQKNFDDAVAWGANVGRIQIFPARYAKGRGQDIWTGLPYFLDMLEAQVKAAEQAGIKVVIDLHEAPFHDVVPQEAEFWRRTDLEENFCRIWTEISKRMVPYKKTIWGYDIYNEPVDRSQYPKPPAQWRPVAVKIVEAIRKIDKSTWIIFEPGPWGSLLGFKNLVPLADSLVIYSPHYYSPQESFTHQGVNVTGITPEEAIKKYSNTYPSVIDGALWNKAKLEQELKYVDEFQAKYKVPIYVGEFSVVRWTPSDGAVNWLKDLIDLFEVRGWSWSYHAFREWHGWSLEYNETFWMEGMPYPQPVTYETERAKVIKTAFLKNKK